MSRFAKRKDANHNPLTEAFERLGCRVMDTSRLGGGAMDAIVQYGGLTMCVEFKDGAKPPSARKLTDAEAKAHSKMMIRIVEDLDGVESAVKTLRRWQTAIFKDMNQLEVNEHGD